MKLIGEFNSPGAEHTLHWGEALAKALQPGDSVMLIGELGAGKTVIARGIARGLGYDGVVTSPSFTIIKTYEGEMTMRHCDLYRLAPGDDLRDIGLDDLLQPEGIAVFEWSERNAVIANARPRWEVRIEFAASDDERLITWKKII